MPVQNGPFLPKIYIYFFIGNENALTNFEKHDPPPKILFLFVPVVPYRTLRTVL
jgi:hypothetical protein